jgi:transposase
MDNTALFTAALQLEYPWKVTNVEFLPDEDNPAKMTLHITVGFEKGAKFIFFYEDGSIWSDEDGNPIECTAHDTVDRTWRHLNFFQYETYIHAKMPKVSDGQGHCPTVQAPWARKNSGFTLLFESWVLELAKHVPVAAIARLVGEHDGRLWRIIKHYVDEARKLKDYSTVASIGMDETSRKGHNYITVVVDLKERNVIFATEGKDHTTVDTFVEDFKAHNGNPDNIRIVTCDMSLGFRKGIADNFPNSQTIIDKFHVIKHANEAVDAVRKAESKENPILKKTKYLWLKNEGNLTDKQLERKQELMKASRHLKTGRAYAMRVELQDIYEQASDRQTAEARLSKLCTWMMHSRLAEMKKLCRLIKDHWNEILNYFDYKFTNAILEGMNSIIQNVKRRARGFRNTEYFKTMIYLNCSDLDIEAVITMA